MYFTLYNFLTNMQNNQWRLVGKSEKKSLTNNLELGILLKKFHILSTKVV